MNRVPAVAVAAVLMSALTSGPAAAQNASRSRGGLAGGSIPSSGQAWWRAEMRARHEAVLQASRPIAIAQGAALLVALFTLAVITPVALYLVLSDE
jgi:hypothetical protein